MMRFLYAVAWMASLGIPIALTLVWTHHALPALERYSTPAAAIGGVITLSLLWAMCAVVIARFSVKRTEACIAMCLTVLFVVGMATFAPHLIIAASPLVACAWAYALVTAMAGMWRPTR